MAYTTGTIIIQGSYILWMVRSIPVTSAWTNQSINIPSFQINSARTSNEKHFHPALPSLRWPTTTMTCNSYHIITTHTWKLPWFLMLLNHNQWRTVLESFYDEGILTPSIMSPAMALISPKTSIVFITVTIKPGTPVPSPASDTAFSPEKTIEWRACPTLYDRGTNAEGLQITAILPVVPAEPGEKKTARWPNRRLSSDTRSPIGSKPTNRVPWPSAMATPAPERPGWDGGRNKATDYFSLSYFQYQRDTDSNTKRTPCYTRRRTNYARCQIRGLMSTTWFTRTIGDMILTPRRKEINNLTHFTTYVYLFDNVIATCHVMVWWLRCQPDQEREVSTRKERGIVS